MVLYVTVEELLNKVWPIRDDVEREEIDKWFVALQLRVQC